MTPPEEKENLSQKPKSTKNLGTLAEPVSQNMVSSLGEEH
jgi:hypothetical protein